MTLYASNRPDTGPTNADTVVINAPNAAAGTSTHNPLHDAVLTWLNRHPDLLVKYSDGTGWWMTTRARREQPLGWFALIHHTGNGLAITPAGRRIAGRHIELAPPKLITLKVANFAEGLLLDGNLTEAIRDVLAIVEREHRRAVPSHRRAPSVARWMSRLRLGWWTR